MKIGQNELLIVLSSICAYQAYWGQHIHHCHHMVAAYLVWDLCRMPRADAVIHHALTLYLYGYLVFNDISPEITKTLIIPFVKTEVSNIFLAMTTKMEEDRYELGVKYTVFKLCFMATFFWYRIYGLYNAFYMDDVYNNALLMTRANKDIWYYSMKAVNNLFYMLNLYWAAIIVKILVKKLMKRNSGKFSPIKHLIINEWLLQYTYGVNQIISFKIYRNYNEVALALDTVGISLLSIFSAAYHRGLYLSYGRYNRLLPNEDSKSLFLMDNLAIRVRSVLYLMTLAALNSNVGWYIKYTVAIHIVCMLNTNHSIKYATDVSLFYDKVKKCIEIPILIDLFVIGCYSNGYFTQLMLATYLMYINSKVKPFYEYTHLALHVMFYWQTWILCKIITNQ